MNLLLVMLYWIVLSGLGSVNPTKLKVTIRSGGATLPASVYKSWKQVYQAYRQLYSMVDLSYQPVGQDQALRRFQSGEYHYAGLNDDLTDVQYNNVTFADYQLFPTFAMPISIAYNVPEISENADIAGDFSSGRQSLGNMNLTRENVLGIFNGTIKYWNDSLLVADNAGLAEVHHRIIVAVRKDAAGATGIFTRALAAFSTDDNNRFSSFSDGCSKSGIPIKWNPSMNIQCVTQNLGLAFYILNTKYSIGYAGSSEARDAQIPDARLLNQENRWTRPSVRTVQGAMDNVSTDLGTRLTGSLVNAPGPLSYPIAGYTYILIRRTTMVNCTAAMELYRMFAYLLEDDFAQSIVADTINTPLSPIVRKQVVQHALNEMRCQGQLVQDLVAVAISIEDGSYDAWKLPVIIVCALIGVALVMLTTFFIYVKYTQNRSAIRNTFIIALNPIEPVTAKSTGSLPTMSIASTNPSKAQTHDTIEWATGTGSGVVKVQSGEQFLVRTICSHLIPDTMQWSAKIMLVKLKEKISHANILKLIGVSLHDEKWKMVTNCPGKGRLQDILHAGKYHLEAVFRYSILADLADGMIYLHKNGLVHGQLTSNSCYIDARWNVVVGDWEQYALHQAQRVQFIAFENLYSEANAEPERDIANYSEYLKSLYWSAPEAITRDYNDIFIVSTPEKPADVYSYGIIAFEVFTDMLPYENTIELDAISRPHLVLAAIKVDNLRPKIPADALQNSVSVTNLITSTWRREAVQRPTFFEIQKLVKAANPKHRSIVDSMMQAVENYALSLEEKVAERTRELEKLTANMESLLHSMLPASIADKLAKGHNVEPEFYESSTLFFSDIVGFTSLAAASSPIDIVTLLNDLYSAFDGVIQRFDVYKVETIGDSYMCISGLPNRNGKLELIPEQLWQVVGITMPRYCLFGDTVNTASRMESTSLPMRIQISEATQFLLDSLKIYNIIARGQFVVKGKGMMKTYWLVGKDGYHNQLPTFDATQDDQLILLLDEAQLK
ncbi:Guanylate cyclase 2G [Hypsibius exemplaris]|uniref:guanylate cyclase n=1 Tax=Hypsibius exemplaris TaxID=2072580 RepID=A0A1W0X7Y7_HYPEX|nr:Guanylate cyclase 2G [Hypsibius exemplaris]